MSANTAELTLIIKAKNLADIEMAKVRAGLEKITVTARTVAHDVAESFKGVGKRIGRQFGNLATDILSGGSVQYALVSVGATMAGALVEGLSVHLIPMILEKVLATAAFAPIAAALTAGGLTLGSVLATAIAVGMAAFPFVLLAVAVAALVYLAVNPEARQKVHDVALMILGKIGDGLRALPKVLGDIFNAAMKVAAEIVRNILRTVIKFFLDLPLGIANLVKTLPAVIGAALNAVLDKARQIVGVIVDAILAIPRAIADAIAALNKLGGTKFTVVEPGTRPSRHAEGGWAGLHGPELSWLGEKGPEYVVPNHQLNRGAPVAQGVTILGVTEAQIVEMVDRGLYFRLQRSAPTLGRT